MKFKYRIAGSLSLLAMAAMYLHQPANAADWRDFVDNLVNRGDSYNGARLNGNQIQALHNMEAASAQIRTQIDSGLASGRLSQDQAAHYRADLRRIAEMRNDAVASNSLDFGQAKALLDRLTDLQTRVNGAYNSGVSYNYNHHGYGFNQNRADGLDALRSRVMGRLIRNRNTGRLSPSEYNGLRAQLDDVTSRLERMRAQNGYLNGWQRNNITAKFNEIDTKITESVAGRENPDNYGYSGYSNRWHTY